MLFFLDMIVNEIHVFRTKKKSRWQTAPGKRMNLADSSSLYTESEENTMATKKSEEMIAIRPLDI